MVTARGTLSRDTSHLLGAVFKALVEDRRVVVDVSQVRLVEPAAALVLPAVLDLADGWPWRKMVLAGPPPPLVDALGTKGSDLLPCYSDQVQAAAHLDERPVRVRRRTTLPPTPPAVRTARVFLTETAQAWCLTDDLVLPALITVTELTSNAIEHAATELTLVIEHQCPTLHIRVRDHAPALTPILVHPDCTNPRGRGLLMVDALTDAWGVHLHPPHSKTVWAALSPPPQPGPYGAARRRPRR